MRRNRPRQPVLALASVAVAIALLTSGASFADILFFQSGGVLHGRIQEENNRSVIVELMGGGRIALDREIVKSTFHETEAQYLIKRGDYWLRQEEFAKAETDYFDALERDPGNEDILNRLRRIEDRKKIAEARRLVLRAQRWMEVKGHRQAIDLLQRALDVTPEVERGFRDQIRKEKAVAHARLGYFFFNRCYDEWALEELATATELDPQLGETYFVYARIYHHRNQLDDAARAYRQSLDLNPENSLAQNYLLQVEEERKRRPGVL